MLISVPDPSAYQVWMIDPDFPLTRPSVLGANILYESFPIEQSYPLTDYIKQSSESPSHHQNTSNPSSSSPWTPTPALTTMSAPPNFVFTYLPAAIKPAALNEDKSTPTFYDQSAAFLQSARNAVVTPKPTPVESQIATLEQTRVHMQQHAVLKAKAGMGNDNAERDQIRTVERAIVELRK